MVNLNRLKIVLIEKDKTGKWLSEQLGKSTCTVSKWCKNTVQPDLITLDKIAKLLDVDVKDLLNSTEKTNQHIIAKAKPFIKWVGGKSQLIDQLDMQLPADFGNWENATYIEPFVGGGAMLFYMLQRYPNIEHAVINDSNPDLVTCYRTVRDNPK